MASAAVNETSLCSEGLVTGHAVYYEQPNTFNRIALEFLGAAR